MGLRFWRRMQLAPGLSLNFSKSGVSVSVGPRGAKFTIGARGARATVGIPGTGIYYTKRITAGTGDTKSSQSDEASSARRREREEAEVPAVQGAYALHTPNGAVPSSPAPPSRVPVVADRLTLNSLQRAMTSDDEELFVDGCREYVRGNADAALAHLQKALHLADAAYLAGVLAVRKRLFDEAVRFWAMALENKQALGKLFAKYQIHVQTVLPITDEITVQLLPDERCLLLGLAEVHQEAKRPQSAITCLNQLLAIKPDDVGAKLALIELLLSNEPDNTYMCQKIIEIAKNIENESFLHAAIMLYKAKALRKLRLFDAARETLAEALRYKKDRPPELLLALRYERAIVYEALGQAKKARSELERLYADAPGYEDVAQRLGL